MYQQVVIFGAGMVVRPLVKYLTTRDYTCIIASRTRDNIEKLIDGLNNCDVVECNVTKDIETMNTLISDLKTVIVVSMVPYIYHGKIFELCLKHSKHFLSTSYTQEIMHQSKDEVISKGMIVVNEAGLYPGIDTAKIMQIRDELVDEGYKIMSIKTFCGGIPAPEANDNPFGYKFSWAPRGVWLAENNGAKYLEDGKVFEFDTRLQVLQKTFWEDFGGDIGKLEGIANRDSTKYIELYNVYGIDTFIRGSLRYPGWTDIIALLHKLDILSVDECHDIAGKSWAQVISDKISCPQESLKNRIDSLDNDYITDAFDFLDIYNTGNIIPKDLNPPTMLDAFTHLTSTRMQYGKDERDMIPMIHKFTAIKGDMVREVVSKAVFYGNENGTAMENTVSLPVAVVAELILTGKFTEPGIHILNKKCLYEPVLQTLESNGYLFETAITTSKNV